MKRANSRSSAGPVRWPARSEPQRVRPPPLPAHRTQQPALACLRLRPPGHIARRARPLAASAGESTRAMWSMLGKPYGVNWCLTRCRIKRNEPRKRVLLPVTVFRNSTGTPRSMRVLGSMEGRLPLFLPHAAAVRAAFPRRHVQRHGLSLSGSTVATRAAFSTRRARTFAYSRGVNDSDALCACTPRGCLEKARPRVDHATSRILSEGCSFWCNMTLPPGFSQHDLLPRRPRRTGES